MAFTMNWFYRVFNEGITFARVQGLPDKGGYTK